jgi:hypothetical protein
MPSNNPFAGVRTGLRPGRAEKHQGMMQWACQNYFIDIFQFDGIIRSPERRMGAAVSSKD